MVFGEGLVVGLGLHQDDVPPDSNVAGVAARQKLRDGLIDSVNEMVVEAFPQAARLNVGVHAGERGFHRVSFLLRWAKRTPNLPHALPSGKPGFRAGMPPFLVSLCEGDPERPVAEVAAEQV